MRLTPDYETNGFTWSEDCEECELSHLPTVKRVGLSLVSVFFIFSNKRKFIGSVA